MRKTYEKRMISVPVEAIIDQARLAPSGDNIQPWLVKIISDREWWVFKNQPDSLSLSNYFRGGLYCGVGAFIEAIVIAASQHGFRVSVTYTEDIRPETGHLASLMFEAQSDSGQREALQPLYTVFSERRTDRRRYARTAIERDSIEKIQKSASHLGGRVICIENPSLLRRLSKAFSKHDDFFWTNDEKPREDLVKLVHRFKSPSVSNVGMPTNTLGLGWKGRFLPSIFRTAYYIPWLWKLIGWQSKYISEDLIRHSGAIVLITLPKQREKKIFEPGYQVKDDLDGGRILLRSWLLATTMGLSVQPVYALVAQMQNEGSIEEGEYFLRLNQEVITELVSIAPNLKQETLVAAFRIGRPLSTAPVPSSPRKPLEEIIWDVKA